MSIQSSKNLLYITLFFTHTLVPLSIQNTAHCYQQSSPSDSWKYLEFYFIIEPNQKIQTASMSLSVKIGALISTLFLATRAMPSKKITMPGRYNDVEIDAPRINIDPSTLITTSILASAAGYWYNGIQEQNIRQETLYNFLKNWNYHRQFVPEELIPAFDQLAINFNLGGNQLNSADINQIFTIVQHLIEHTFTKRYPKEKKSTDLLGAIKTITDIGKNISPSK